MNYIAPFNVSAKKFFNDLINFNDYETRRKQLLSKFVVMTRLRPTCLPNSMPWWPSAALWPSRIKSAHCRWIDKLTDFPKIDLLPRTDSLTFLALNPWKKCRWNRAVEISSKLHCLTSSLTRSFFRLTPDLLLPLLPCFQTRRICNKLLTNSTTRWTQGLGVIQWLDLPLVSCCFKNHRLFELTDAHESTMNSDCLVASSMTRWTR